MSVGLVGCLLGNARRLCLLAFKPRLTRPLTTSADRRMVAAYQPFAYQGVRISGKGVLDKPDARRVLTMAVRLSWPAGSLRSGVHSFIQEPYSLAVIRHAGIRSRRPVGVPSSVKEEGPW